MPTPRKSLRTRRKIVETSSSLSSSDSECEVVTKCFPGLNVKDGTPNKNKTPNKSSEPSYITRSGRKVVSTFRTSTIGESSKDDSDSESSSSASSPSLPDSGKPSAPFKDDEADTNMFGLRTPRKHTMLAKESGSITKTPKDGAKTPKTPGTAKGSKATSLLKGPSRRKIVETTSSSSSSDNESEVVAEFFTGLNVKDATSNKKHNKTQKNAQEPLYTTRSGRQVVPKFRPSTLGKFEKDDSDTESSSASSPSLPDSEKPSVLFEDDKAIECNMFGFQTPKRKHSMLAKASGSVTKTPKDEVKTPKTPATSKGVKTKLQVGVTPRASRCRMKRKISREAARQKFSTGSDSEYEPTQSSESDDSSDNEDAVPLEDVKEEEEPPKKEATGMVTRRRKARCNDSSFIFTSDDYFERLGTKSVTSNHNLNKLKNPRLQQDQLMALLKDVHPRHKNVLKELDSENQSMFKRWLFAMSQGFNVLLYGVGSKRTLLNSFHAKHLSSSPVLVVNGFFPGTTIKDILDSLASGVLKIKKIPTQPHEVVESIASKLKSSNEPDVFVLLHNLDGEVLRVEKSQAVLARLASLPKVHLIASIDHINSPLLWDQNKLSQFNFIWEDATSFLPYFEETSFESSLMVQRSGTIALTALRNVFQSLNVNARRVFRLLMDDQLKNGGKSYQGMLFSDLYRACRNSFIVSSDLALRTQLTEFFDHKLVKHKKDTDHLSVPVDRAVLKQFHDEIASEE